MKRTLLLATATVFVLGLSPPSFARNLSVPPGQPGGGATTGQNQGSAKGAYGAAQPGENNMAPETGAETTPAKHKGKHHHHHSKHGKHR